MSKARSKGNGKGSGLPRPKCAASRPPFTRARVSDTRVKMSTSMYWERQLRLRIQGMQVERNNQIYKW